MGQFTGSIIDLRPLRLDVQVAWTQFLKMKLITIFEICFRKLKNEIKNSSFCFAFLQLCLQSEAETGDLILKQLHTLDQKLYRLLNCILIALRSSFICKRNRVGERTELCGAPVFIWMRCHHDKHESRQEAIYSEAELSIW